MVRILQGPPTSYDVRLFGGKLVSNHPTRKCQHQQCTEPGTAEVYVYEHFLLYCKPHAYDLTYALLRANVPYQTRLYTQSTQPVQPDLDYWRKGTV